MAEHSGIDVDVGVVTHGTRDLTVEALTRLLERTDGLAMRVLVQDNASDDGTADAIRKRFPEVDVGVNDRNLGFGTAMNQLIRRSSAPWFFALNSDAWPEPGALARLVEAGHAYPAAAAIAPRLERPDGTLEHSTFPFPSPTVAAITALGAYRRLCPKRAEDLTLVGAWNHDRPREVDWAVGAALLMRRAALDAIGGFDERFFMYAEDLEWCWRAHAAGWTVRFEPKALVRHVGGASSETTYGPDSTRAHVHNSYRFYRRVHGRLPTVGYRMLNLLGYARLWLLAAVRRDPGSRRWWATELRAHASRVTAEDGPPRRR